METVAYYNGQISEIDDMMIPMTDRGFTFGDGVYDATMARNQKIFANGILPICHLNWRKKIRNSDFVFCHCCYFVLHKGAADNC